LDWIDVSVPAGSAEVEDPDDRGWFMTLETKIIHDVLPEQKLLPGKYRLKVAAKTSDEKNSKESPDWIEFTRP
jgi:hypothetical protein